MVWKHRVLSRSTAGVAMIGKSLGPYRILEPLGIGGMGEVYRALDTRLDRQVAIKLLPETLAADAERLARFDREAKLLASLNHPKIASIYSMEAEGSTPFLVLELVEGVSVEERLSQGSLTVTEAMRVGRQIAEALAAAHDAGVVHRDLKPANVMLVGDALDVKVLDFGIAKAMQAGGDDIDTTGLTKTGTLLGTTPYISPEQLRGEPSDHRADIWAFGCLMYEALTAESPFARTTTTATVAAVLETEPDWDRLPSQTPARVRALLQRCLDKDPQGRIARMRDAMIQIEATEAGARSPTVRAFQRNRLARWAIVGVGTAVGIGALYATGFLGDASGPSAPSAPAINYLAVLPFENQSGDPGQDYVAAAMTDQLTTSLGSIEGLRVLGRQSAQSVTGLALSPVEFAEEQELDALVTGAVFQVGEDVRVTVQLLDGRTGDQVWGSSFQGTAGEMFALTDSTLLSVGREIGGLAAQEAQRAAALRSVDPEVLNAYGLGTFYMQDYTEDAMSRAIVAFDQAINLDPDFAPAHAARARAYMLMVENGLRPAAEYLPIAQAGMDLAMSIDSTQAEVLSHEATLRFRTRRNWTGLREQYERALELNPNSGDVWHAYSHFLEGVIDPEGVLESARRYHEVEPLTRGPWFHTANVRRNRREWDAVVAVADSGLAIYPDYQPLRIIRSRALIRMGRTEEGVEELEEILNLTRDPLALGALALGYIDLGNEAGARSLQSELEDLNQLWLVAIIHAALGDMDAAFEVGERGVDANQRVQFMHVHSDWDPMRVERDRWRELLEYAGFPQDLIERSMAVG